MDRDEDLREASDLTREISIVDYAPVFVGAYSHIFKGSYRGEPVAIKVLRYNGVSLRAMIRKMTREREVWARMKHPNVAPMYGYTEESKLFGPFGALISPWHEYGDADQFLRQYGASLSIEERRKLWKGVVEGVAYLHTYDPIIIHGDLKPSNVLIDNSGTPRICDFGLSRIFLGEGNSGMTTTTPHTGTDRYLAYELVMTQSVYALSKASDVYALGCIGLYFLSLRIPYGHRPNNFLGGIFQDIRNGVPPAIRPTEMDSEGEVYWDILESCWSIDPDQRPEVSVILEKLNPPVERLPDKNFITDYLGDSRIGSQDSDTEANWRTDIANSTSAWQSMSSMVSPANTPMLVIGTGSATFSSQEIWSSTSRQLRLSTNEKPQNNLSLPRWNNRHEGPLPSLDRRLSDISVRPLVEGAYSIVYQETLDYHQSVAIKCLRNPPVITASAQPRLRRELKTWWCLQHENIVPLLGIVDDERFGISPAMVSPWYKNGTASVYLDSRNSVSLSQRVKLFHGVARGVNYLHTFDETEILDGHSTRIQIKTKPDGIVHGNLNPRNVLVDDDGVAKICDFGLLRLVRDSALNGMSIKSSDTETIRYLSSELVSDDDTKPTTASDVYALACIGIWFIYGTPPHSHSGMYYNLSRIEIAILFGQLPAIRPKNCINTISGLWDLFEACWSIDPSKRPSAADVCQFLEENQEQLIAELER